MKTASSAPLGLAEEEIGLAARRYVSRAFLVMKAGEVLEFCNVCV